ncbi:hypothetical protein D9611_007715 [Ephemerocybe angulata]|uniref:Uncharacterized protein n=1 Tax=Ephemerocybe angulata TaxID=980116 RepID=A0A8H5FCR7_9AGAR|nr:hypothetical protein D9611_007715 [Tulosesus angulatus]
MLGEGARMTPSESQLEPLLGAVDQHDHELEIDIGKRPELEAALVRKVDRRMSILVLIYILNYIDRNNAA